MESCCQLPSVERGFLGNKLFRMMIWRRRGSWEIGPEAGVETVIHGYTECTKEVSGFPEWRCRRGTPTCRLREAPLSRAQSDGTRCSGRRSGENADRGERADRIGYRSGQVGGEERNRRIGCLRLGVRWQAVAGTGAVSVWPEREETRWARRDGSLSFRMQGGIGGGSSRDPRPSGARAIRNRA
jgi:hypothetical protein